MRLPWFQDRRRGVTDREPSPQITQFGGIAQRRDRVNVWAQEVPDPIKQGAYTPARPAVMPIAILTGMDPQAVAEGRFVAVIIGPPPLAAYPHDRMTPTRLRSNIRVPPHVAYGSLSSAGMGVR